MRPEKRQSQLTRRELLQRSGMGFGSLGLLGLVSQAGLLGSAHAGAPTPQVVASGPHFPGKAKHVIHLFMNGGPSQVDTFDPKPALQKYEGKNLPTHFRTESDTTGAMPSPFEFRKYGQSGIDISSIYPHVAKHADELTVIRSMVTELPNHEPSLMYMNCGEARLVRPSMGSWITYGLGSANENLPGFIAMCPEGYPTKAVQNWQSAFLPGVHQGTYVDTRHEDVDKLVQHIKNQHLSHTEQRRQLDLLELLNRRHLEKRQLEAPLEARIRSFELAYNMQMEAADAFDISQEPASIRDLYGEGVQARQMIMARRLVERGVRFVQVWYGKGQPWDQHQELEEAHRKHAGASDQAIGALLTDLKQRGLLDETIVIWGGEFGRTPTAQINTDGRDHNPFGFSLWIAGGGFKGGTIYGATDEFGFQAVKDITTVHDLHATILHQLGFDHTQLTYRYSGRDFRLTDVYGNVIHDILT